MNRLFAFFILLLVLDAVLLLRMFDAENGLPGYLRLEEKTEELQKNIAIMRGANKQLSAEIRTLKTDKFYTQRLIKRELFYLSDNEIMYIVK